MAVTSDQLLAGSGLLQSYASSQYQKAAGIQEQTAYLVKARDTLAVAEVRADMDQQYAEIQAGRILRKSELEAMNYKIAGNTLLKNLRATNATIRARAAASGVAVGEGSNLGIQQQNVAATMRDVDIADYNALAAKVFGFEDATALMQSTGLQRTLNLYSAERQAGQYETAGAAARSKGGILSDFTLLKGATEFGRTFTPSASKKPAGDN